MRCCWSRVSNCAVHSVVEMTFHEDAVDKNSNGIVPYSFSQVFPHTERSFVLPSDQMVQQMEQRDAVFLGFVAAVEEHGSTTLVGLPYV
jgi:hypothetical protein